MSVNFVCNFVQECSEDVKLQLARYIVNLPHPPHQAEASCGNLVSSRL